MSRQYLCVIWIEGTPTEYHEFTMPEIMEKGGYRAIGSYEAFRNGQNRKLYNANLKGIHHLPRRASVDRLEDHALFATFKIMKRSFPQTIKHESLWALYTAIGWDYKRKKWIA